MAFVVNVGATLAADLSYSLRIGSSKNETTSETYIEHANATGTTGKYYYSAGSYNNQLSINYGFSNKHDLMIRFTATYSNPNHKANDFSINFVNRDNWCIDMNRVQTPELTEEGGGTYTNTFYGLTSTTTSISGVMYYMGKLDGAGTMPIISGVTFYTSPDNSFNLVGDELTITITPTYVKSKSSNYDVSKHSFKDSLLTADSTAFANWIAYQAGTNNTNAEPTYMAYNAYANENYALKFPSDYDWTPYETVQDAEGNDVVRYTFNLVGQDEKLYSNTAYRYSVSYDPVLKEGSSTEYEYKRNRNYAAVIAGNKYYGGTGIYVIPGADKENPVEITIGYAWQKGGAFDNMYTNMVKIIEDDNWSDDIFIAGTGHYSIMKIDKPVYIDILDYIMLTAEDPYMTLLHQGYGLVITSITASQTDNAPAGWVSQNKDSYDIINSTEKSPALVRVQNVSSSTKIVTTNASVVNNSDKNMKITQFSVKAKLWYSTYQSGNDGQGNTVVSAWAEKLLNDAGTIKDSVTTYNYMPKIETGAFKGYNAGLWKLDTTTPIEYLNTDGVNGIDTVQFNFVSNGEVYVAPGYSMQLIDSLWIPKQYYPVAEDFVAINNSSDGHGNKLYTPIEVYDMWCSIDVNVTTTSSTSCGQNTEYSGIESVTNGYHSFVESGNGINIYVKNNTKQNITSVTLSSLFIATENTEVNVNLIDRERIDEGIDFGFKVKMIGSSTEKTYYTNSEDQFESESAEVLIRPNDTVLLCTITDIADASHSNYIISRYTITASLAEGAESMAADLVKNTNTASADLINGSEFCYEFRIVAPTTSNISSKIANCATDFEVKTVGGNEYYYYKGVICIGQCITILTNLETTAGFDVELIKHVANRDGDYYVASNYTEWNTNNELSDSWLNIMQNIYSAPSFE